MAYNAQFDLRGKRIQDTYTQVLQYDSSSGAAYTGQGSSLNISSSFAATASFASTAAFSNNATSASYAPQPPLLSASYAPVEPDYSSSVSSAKQNALIAGNTYAITSSWSDNAVSASWAPDPTVTVVSASWASASISSSLSAWADLASASISLRGLNVQLATQNSNSVAPYTSTLNGQVTTNETAPHATLKLNNQLFCGGWGGGIYRLNDPDNNIADITTSSLSASYATATGPRAISDVCYSDTTGYLYFIIQGTYPTSTSTASIVKVDPVTLSSSYFYNGIGGYDFGLPVIVSDGPYIYAVTDDGTIAKIDAVTGTLISSSTWVSASVTIAGAHAAKMDPNGTYFYVQTSRSTGHVARIATSDLSQSTVITSNGVTSVGSLTDDFALIGDYFYPVFESGTLGYLKINKNTLSQSYVYGYQQSYGTFSDGTHLYLAVKAGPPSGEIWVYPYAEAGLGPVRFSMPSGLPNEIWNTDGGKIVVTSWTTPTVYSLSLPLVTVGINQTPQFAFDVAGTIHGTTLSSSTATADTIIFNTTLRNTASNFSVSQTSVRIGQYTGSGAIAASGIRVGFISASVVTASLGFFGTASNAVSASWAPFTDTGTTLVTASTYEITSSNAVSASWAPSGAADSASYLQTIGGGVTIEPSSVIVSGNGGEVGLASGRLGIQGTSVANDGWIGQNEFDSGGGYVRRADGYVGLLEFRNPSFYIKMGDYGLSGSAVSPETTQFKISGRTNTVSIGGNVNTFHSTWTGASLISSGSGQVSINKGALADAGVILDVNGKTVVSSSVTATQGFTGSLFGTASNAVSASWAPTAVAGTTLVTASTYDITSSWATTAVSIRSPFTASDVQFTNNLVQGQGHILDYTVYGGVIEGAANYGSLSEGCHLEGSASSVVVCYYSHTEGKLCYIGNSTGGHAEGIGSSILEANAGHAEGYYTQIGQTGRTAHAAHAEGWQTKAIGRGAHSQGAYTTASGDYSTAIGQNITVNGSRSVGIQLDTTTGNIVNNNDVFVIMGGKVGIGVLSPSQSLSVNGDINANYVTASLNGTASWANDVNSASWASSSITAYQVIQNGVSSPIFLSNDTWNYTLKIDGNDERWHFTNNAAVSASQFVGNLVGTASWASKAVSASWAPFTQTEQTSGSWASASFVATSASFASQSISSSYAVTASYAANAAGTVLATGSTYQITASWAINTVNGGGNTSTQSSYDISMKDMQFPFTAAFAGITPALLNGSSFDNNVFNRTGNGSINGLVFWYLTFRNENVGGGNELANALTASIGFHQMRVPINYNSAGGLTHSFQYFAMGTYDSVYTPVEGEIPGANDKVYWNVELYSLTSSTSAAANFFSAPILVGRNIVTESFSGAIHESGSMETITSVFSGSSLTNDCMFFINVKRLNLDSSSVAAVGDRTDYTGSVAMVSSRVSFNTM